jgi:hypothetical protein
MIKALEETVARAICLSKQQRGDTAAVAVQYVDTFWRDYLPEARIAVATLLPLLAKPASSPAGGVEAVAVKPLEWREDDAEPRIAVWTAYDTHGALFDTIVQHSSCFSSAYLSGINGQGEETGFFPTLEAAQAAVNAAYEARTRKYFAALSPSTSAAEPVAWMDDGSTRAGSHDTAYRVVTADTKAAMPKAAAEAYRTPLYTHPAPATVDGQRSKRDV